MPQRATLGGTRVDQEAEGRRGIVDRILYCGFHKKEKARGRRNRGRGNRLRIGQCE